MTIKPTNKSVEFFNKDIANLRDHMDKKFNTQERLMANKIEQLRSDTYKVVFCLEQPCSDTDHYCRYCSVIQDF